MFGLFKKRLTVVTHSGSFHADEVFACATLLIWAQKRGYKLKIIRSRDKEDIKNADIVVDVGMQYDSDKNRFDHHQNSGAGEHQNGIPYASFGLVWKHYGEEVCNGGAVAEMIEKKLVIPIDAKDNGINNTKLVREDVPEYSVIKELVFAFRPTWQDPLKKKDQNFNKFLRFAKQILENEIRLCKSILVGEDKVRTEIRRQGESKILIFEKDLPWEKVISEIKKIKVVIYPELDLEAWCAETPMDSLIDFNSHRTLFPKSWWGLKDEDLRDASNINEAIFCHRAGYFAVAKTKEGAIEMAKRALQIGEN